MENSLPHYLCTVQQAPWVVWQSEAPLQHEEWTPHWPAMEAQWTIPRSDWKPNEQLFWSTERWGRFFGILLVRRWLKVLAWPLPMLALTCFCKSNLVIISMFMIYSDRP